MASGVNGNSLEGFFKVTVQQWGTTGEDDCLWNIAKGVLQEKGIENPTAQQINETMNSIIQNQNELSDRKLEKDSIIYTGEQILVPLEDAIDGIENNVDAMIFEYDQLKADYDSYCSKLPDMNADVQTAKENYDKAYKEFCKYPAGANIPPKTNAENAMNKAKEEYSIALKVLQEQMKLIDDVSAELSSKNDKINTFKEELKQYVDDYDENEKKIDEQLKEVTGYIAEIDDETNKLLKDLHGLYQKLEDIDEDATNPENNDEYTKAQDSLSNGVKEGALLSYDLTSGVTYPSEFGSDSTLTSYVIDKNTGKNNDYIVDTEMSADGKEYKFTLKDGNIVTYKKEETGKWVLKDESKNRSKEVAASDWEDYYIDPNTGEQRADVDSVTTSEGGRYTNITYSDGTSVTIDKQTGTVTGTGLDKFNAAATGKSTEGSGDNNTSTTNTSGEYAELIKACNSKKNDDITEQLRNIVNDSNKTFTEILENLNDTQKKAVATALSNVLDNPSNVGDEDKILINDIQDEINGENGTGSVTSFINDEEYKDNESGLTLAEKWQRYNCCKYFDDDNFSTFVENSGNSELTKDKIAGSTDVPDFNKVRELYSKYEKYTDYINAFVGNGKASIYASYSNAVTGGTEFDNVTLVNITSLNGILDGNASKIYTEDILGQFSKDDWKMYEEFIATCDEILNTLGMTLDDFL